MKSILVACSLLLFFVSCNKPQNPPTAVLDGMFTAMKNGQFNDMKKFITQSDIALLEAAEKIMSQLDPAGVEKIKARMTEELKTRAKNLEYHFKNEKVDGDRATVEAEIIDHDPTLPAGGKTMSQTFELVKENNAWKIALSNPGNAMFNSMKGNMGNRKGDLKTGVEKLQQMNPDSLKMLIGKGLQALDSMDKLKNKQ